VQKVTGINKGRSRQLKSCVGRLAITKQQASRLGVPAYKRLSPLLEICCLLLSANESYHNAETDIETLTLGEGWAQHTATRFAHASQTTSTNKRLVFTPGEAGNY
jgi:hypothetical protein